MSNDFQPAEPKPARVSIYDRTTPPRPVVPFDAATLTMERIFRKRMLRDGVGARFHGRDKSREWFPEQFEGRKGQSARINIGIYAHGKLKGAICDVRASSGDRVFDTVRYMRGRHPSESVEHYEARRGR